MEEKVSVITAQPNIFVVYLLSEKGELLKFSTDRIWAFECTSFRENDGESWDSLMSPLCGNKHIEKVDSKHISYMGLKEECDEYIKNEIYKFKKMEHEKYEEKQK
tara:strand:- start:1570 stop:1884 length:315 start_codon:yes stop_codon:yes gene_type:complete